jgi:hypothetical protein
MDLNFVREESKLQAADMKFPRGIVGKTETGRRRNIYITGELKMEGIQKQIRRNTLRWSGRIKK